MKMPTLERRLRLVLTLLVAFGGGWLASRLDTPSAPLLGAMLATLTASILNVPLSFPRWLRRCVVVYIGLNVGAALQPADLLGFATWLPSLLGLIASLTATLALVSLLLRRVGSFPPVTAFYSAYPGHLVLVVQEAARGNADVQRVTMVQSLRVLALVGALPVVIGALDISMTVTEPLPTDWLAAGIVIAAGMVGIAVTSKFGLPMVFLLGPMVGAASASLAGMHPGNLPPAIEQGAMIVTGAMIGTRLIGARRTELLRVLPISLVAVAVAIAVAAAFALPVSLLLDIPLISLLLAYAPGGAEVMAMVALATGQDAAFVGLHHLLRLLMMAVVLPFLANRVDGSSQVCE